MTITVETFMLISLTFAVFAAVTAIGASILLSVGYERLRSGLQRLKDGLDLVTRQTSFFSESIHKLDEKVLSVEVQTGRFSESIDKLQGNVERVDKQTGFFSDAINRLEKKVQEVESSPQPIALKDLMASPGLHDETQDVSGMMVVASETLGKGDSLNLQWSSTGLTTTFGNDKSGSVH
ncbi:MAG: hypothetical protein H6863_01185 [Rhodospirillales bacterium]|nr:hypothetical protein [Rhodospirillales bacterium]